MSLLRLLLGMLALHVAMELTRGPTAAPSDPGVVLAPR